MHDHPTNSDLSLLLQSLQHQKIRLLTILVRDEIVARVKIDGIQFVCVDELENFHEPSRSDL